MAEFDALFADHANALERIDAATLDLRFRADPVWIGRSRIREQYTEVLDGLQALAQWAGHLETGAIRC